MAIVTFLPHMATKKVMVEDRPHSPIPFQHYSLITLEVELGIPPYFPPIPQLERNGEVKLSGQQIHSHAHSHVKK